jgi:hypothetical protein
MSAKRDMGDVMVTVFEYGPDGQKTGGVGYIASVTHEGDFLILRDKEGDNRMLIAMTEWPAAPPEVE